MIRNNQLLDSIMSLQTEPKDVKQMLQQFLSYILQTLVNSVPLNRF